MLHGTRVGNEGLIALAENAKQLSSLQFLGLNGTQVRCVSQEVLANQNPQAIFAAVRDGIAVAEAKVVVLGEPRVGKSSLCERFFQGTIPRERIQTRDFELIRPTWKPRIGNLPINLHVWDFGGQHILHGTHEMFLSQRSVCLLVLDSTQKCELDEEEQARDPHRRGNRLWYWLNMIYELVGPDAHVILVETKCDKEKKRRLKLPLPEDLETLRDKIGFANSFRVVTNFSAMDEKKDEKDECIEPLRAAITLSIDKLGVHSRVGDELHRVKEKVEKEIQGRSLVHLSEYRTWCAAVRVTDPDSQNEHLPILHDFGSVFFYGHLKSKNDQQDEESTSLDNLPRWRRRPHEAPPHPFLNEWLINLYWLKSLVYAVMTDPATAGNKGVLHEREIQDVIDRVTANDHTTKDKNLDSPPPLTTVVLEVLRLNELCLPVDNQGHWFFPSRLSNDASEFLSGWSEKYCDFTPLWDCGFFLETAIHRFILQAFQRNELRSRWRTGAVLEIDGTEGAVLSEPESGRVTVRLRKTDAPQQRQEFLNEIKVRLKLFISRKPIQNKKDESQEANPQTAESAADHPSPEFVFPRDGDGYFQHAVAVKAADSQDPPAAAQQTVSQTQVSDFPTWDQNELTLTFCGKSLTYKTGLSDTDCLLLPAFIETPNKWLGVERILELYGDRNWREAIEKEIESRSRQLQNSSQIDRDDIREQLSERFKKERQKVNQAVHRLRKKLEAKWGASNGQARLTIESKNLKHRIVVLSCDDNEMSSR